MWSKVNWRFQTNVSLSLGLWTKPYVKMDPFMIFYSAEMLNHINTVITWKYNTSPSGGSSLYTVVETMSGRCPRFSTLPAVNTLSSTGCLKAPHWNKQTHQITEQLTYISTTLRGYWDSGRQDHKDQPLVMLLHCSFKMGAGQQSEC